MESRAFRLAVAHVLRVEGGYADDPADPGGETHFGISKRAYPHLDIPALSEAQARAIYHQDYWLAAGCPELPGPLAFALLDAAVNHGPRRGVILLQQTLGVTADGHNDAVTQRAARAAEWQAALVDFLTRRAQLYRDIVAARSSQARFLDGWTRRLFALQAAVYVHQGELT